jgi:large conductance mechanosensitive channel
MMLGDVFRNFRQFLVRGNAVDLAIAVVIGASFTGVVNALVKDIITPLIGAIGGQPNFSGMHFTLHRSIFAYGDFLNTAFSFVLTAAVIYFFVVVPINRLISLVHRQPTASPTTRHCPECLSEIPLEASRCMYCTAKVEPKKAPKDI